MMAYNQEYNMLIMSLDRYMVENRHGAITTDRSTNTTWNCDVEMIKQTRTEQMSNIQGAYCIKLIPEKKLW